MKKGGPTHPKVKRLARTLGVPIPHAVGILETLWHWCYDYAPGGAVGKWDDDVIADACHWPDHASLITALIDTRWLDKCKNNRLVIHDWIEHCPGWLHQRLDSSGQQFALLDLISEEKGSTPQTPPQTPRGVQVGIRKVEEDSSSSEGDARGRETPPSNKPPDPPPPDHKSTPQIDYQGVVDKWNEMAEKNKLPKVMRMTPKRRGFIKRKVATEGFDFDAILEMIPRCPHLLGENDRGWKASFMFVFERNDRWLEILEGKYLSGKQTGKRVISRGENLTGHKYGLKNKKVGGEDDQTA